jgi:hypothetical protein
VAEFPKAPAAGVFGQSAPARMKNRGAHQGEEIVIVNEADAVFCTAGCPFDFASSTSTVNVDETLDLLGFPAIVPLAPSFSPLGNFGEPGAIRHWYGGSPPVALKVAE